MTRPGIGVLANPIGAVVVVLGVFAFMLSVFWTGYVASDDAFYWNAAGKWLTQFPYAGDSHWALRQTLVLPMALTRKLMGNTPLALVLPTILYSLALLAMLTIWLHRHVGPLAAAAAMALVATNPQLVTWSSTADIDPVKMFYVFAASFLYIRALRAGGGIGALAASGILAGLAYLSHETTVFAVGAIGLLFLAGYGMPRARYLTMGISFAIVIGLEFLFMWSMTGDPLHRHRPTMTLQHDVTISRWVDQGATVPIIHPLIDPITMLLFNQSFGLIAWIGLPLTIWLARQPLSPRLRQIVLVLGLIAAAWSALSAGLWKLLPLTPRYFLMPAVIVSVLAGIAIQQLILNGRQVRALVLLGAMVMANVTAVALSNRDLMFSEELLADLAAARSEVIHTDTRTRIRADVILDWQGVGARVVATPPRAGDLFFFNPLRLPPGTTADPAWEVVETFDPPARPVASFIRRHLPDGLVPQKLLRKFTVRHPGAVLYRVQ